MPHDRPVAVPLVNQDYRVTVGCVSDDGVGQVHPRFGQGMTNLPAMGVVAKGADIRRLKPERRARGERRRYLSAAGDLLRGCTEFGVRCRCARQAVDEVNGVFANPYDVKSRHGHETSIGGLP